MGLPPPPRAGSSARRRPSMLSAVTASVRRGFSRGSCATAVVISEHGSWSGTVWSSVSSSQRILSLWLDRLSTDRVARQRRKASSPLVVFGKRGNLDLLLAVDAAAERLVLTARPALSPTRPSPPILRGRAGGPGGASPRARRHCRRLPALHAARRRRSTRRRFARYRRLRASLRRRGESSRRSPRAHDAFGLFGTCRHRRHHRRGFRRGAFRPCDDGGCKSRRARTSCAIAPRSVAPAA